MTAREGESLKGRVSEEKRSKREGIGEENITV